MSQRKRCYPCDEINTPAIELTKINANYGDISVLQNINFSTEKGEHIAVVGPNGAGKSTLLKIIAGVIKPESGQIKIFGKKPDRHVCIAYIDQLLEANQLFPLTVEAVVSMGRMSNKRFPSRDRNEDKQIVTEALEYVSLYHLRNRHFNELSRGQRQRMFIARGLAQQAEVMLLDEPFTGLDLKSNDNLHQIIDSLRGKKTLLIATHDLEVANKTTKILLLNKKMLAFGKPETVLDANNISTAYEKDLGYIAKDYALSLNVV